MKKTLLTTLAALALLAGCSDPEVAYPMDWEAILEEEMDCSVLDDYFWTLTATQEARREAGDSEAAREYRNAMGLANDLLDERCS